jgi:2-oxoisovalerate dehydrogenase E1 component
LNTQIPINWQRVAYLMLLSRKLDTLEEQILTPQGKIKYQFSASGHELTQVLLAQALNHPHDAATVYYRTRPFTLASGLTLEEALAAGLARAKGPSMGRDVGVMFNLPRRTGATILPSSGDVGAQYTPAAGWAQAIRYRAEVLGESSWEGALAVALGGDGSVAANGFWAALNIVTTLRLPMIFFIEDNQFGISVPAHLQTPGGNIAANLSAFPNLQTYETDGCDAACTWETIKQAVLHVRSGTGPALIRLRVPRLSGHTFVDNQAYKSPEQRQDDLSRDPLPCLRQYLIDIEVFTPAQWKDLEAQIDDELQAALAAAENTANPDPKLVTQHVYYEGIPPMQGGLRPEEVLPASGSSTPKPGGPRINLVDAVRRTLDFELSINPRLVIFGEDVGLKGGVHGATIDLQHKYGEKRVFDTSLSEEGILGRGAGMALAGLLPVPEIQFRKYVDPATEQINDLGTLRWRTDNHFAAPLVLRIPVGYSKKTGDPWHSVTAEAIFAHTIGWRIAYPSNAEDAVGLLRTALRGDDPTFFLEHRALLDTAEGRRPYPGDDYCLPFGQAAHLLTGTELTLITWGAMVPRCVEAAQAFAEQVTLLDLRTIIPWDQMAVLESVQKTGKVMIVHEDTRTGGFAGEIIAVITEHAFTSLDASIKRLAPPDIPIPYNPKLMDAVIPTVSQIRNEIEKLLNY